MSTRTVQFIGKAYSTTGNVNVSLDFNNSRIFQGPVTASTDSVPEQITSRDVLFTFELDTSVVGSFPLIIQVAGGTLGFFGLFGNKILTNRPDEFHHLNFNTIDSAGTENVIIDGDLQTRQNEQQEGPGAYCWAVPDNGTLTCDFIISEPVVLPQIS
jgi:hypothetical protein